MIGAIEAALRQAPSAFPHTAPDLTAPNITLLNIEDCSLRRKKSQQKISTHPKWVLTKFHSITSITKTGTKKSVTKNPGTKFRHKNFGTKTPAHKKLSQIFRHKKSAQKIPAQKFDKKIDKKNRQKNRQEKSTKKFRHKYSITKNSGTKIWIKLSAREGRPAEGADDYGIIQTKSW